jgi:AraC-like DNA-binding protein
MKELEPERAPEDTYLSQVRRVVVELLDKENTQLEAVVARLGVSRRTLQRELQQRDTSHKAILDDVRRERALHLLELPGLTVSEVAYRLGFSEPSAFFRAFRRWTGKSPKAAVAATAAQRASREPARPAASSRRKR